MHKQFVVHVYNGIVLTRKKKKNQKTVFDTDNSVGEP